MTKGEYSIKFAEGKDGELVLLKGKKETVQGAYKVTKLAQPAADNSVAYIGRRRWFVPVSSDLNSEVRPKQSC